ncbi:hypothetical protein QVD17_31415 [Tagetes erecta]|uniref:Uncharacterized protein n=1 Tax=Tagetes erecta TaxID=13708 RepID=A0AAD8K6Z1_TARER|nr:hypothetical protein QVD17_31415 [Tagetes erecta]
MRRHPWLAEEQRGEEKLECVKLWREGNYMRTGPNAHYGSASLGNLSNINATMVNGCRPSTNVLTNSWTSSFSSRCSNSFDENTKPWLFIHPQSGPQFSQATVQQQQQQQERTTPQFPSPQVNLYGGITSGVADLHQQSYSPSLFSQQPKFEAGGYQQHNHLQGGQQQGTRSEVQRYGFDSLLPGYGDYMFQMPTSGDVFTPRVFGM